MPETTVTDPQAEALRQQNPGRGQILARLWALANLSPEATRSSISGQIKAMAMIVAIEGLIPDRRLSPSPNHRTTSPVPSPNQSPARPRGQSPVDPQPGAPPANQPALPYHDRSQLPFNPFLKHQSQHRIPDATGAILDAIREAANARNQPGTHKSGVSAGRR